MSDGLTNVSLSTLDERVARIEAYLFPPGGPTNPSILSLFSTFDVKLESMKGKLATQKDLDDLKRIVAELKQHIEELKPPKPGLKVFQG